MKISVIVPCYNAEAYLDACVRSILAQTFSDFELLLIDDGSTDATAEFAQVFANNDPRVRLFSQENAGVSAARNLGLAHAQGEWVVFADADDVLPEDAFARMLDAVMDDTDMVVAAHETFGEGVTPEIVWQGNALMEKDAQGQKQEAILRLIQGDSLMNIMCAKLHRRSALVENGIQLQSGIAIAEDALFNLEAALCAREIAMVAKSVYRYRMHDASATHTREKSEFDAHAPWLAALRETLMRRGVLEEYYAQYVESVTLRLYKDGGVKGVRQNFKEKAAALVSPEGLDKKKLRGRARRYAALCRMGLYGFFYPLIWIGQEIRWQISDRRR